MGEYRVLRWQFKLLFVVAVFAAGWLLSDLLTVAGAGSVAVNIASSILTLGGVIFCARIFRGRGEAIPLARPWWQMTARRKLSRRLGVLFAWLFALGVIGSTFAALGIAPDAPTLDPHGIVVVNSIIGTLQFGAIAFLYLNSVHRLPRPESPRATPNFRPTSKLR
ncbi:hypothetical protein [Cryobacterium arcticum]|nr:hypothetical protein [Cryobacterium arcticum]